MRIKIIAVGRLRKGPEKELIDDYIERARKSGRALGFTEIDIVEVEDRKGGGMSAEAPLLRKAVPNGALLCIMDERGRQMSSPDFAQKLGGWRDAGRDLAILIGGADGLDPSLRSEADFAISFGAMVWPHMLVRVMLSEQIYRGISILSGSPYHRV